MNTKWKDMTFLQKTGLIITIIGAIFTVVFTLKPDIFPVKLTTPSIAVMCIGEAMDHWPKSRKWSWLLVGAAVISMACFVLDLCVF